MSLTEPAKAGGRETTRLAHQTWSVPNDACNWEGVVCEKMFVTDSHLGGRNFSGSIPSDISFLTSLTYLDLSNNDIRGTMPEKLYDLASLKTLYLYKNQLSGTLSPSVGNLENLYVNHNTFTASIPNSLNLGGASRPLRTYT
jgi:hypothetical protein